MANDLDFAAMRKLLATKSRAAELTARSGLPPGFPGTGRSGGSPDAMNPALMSALAGMQGGRANPTAGMMGGGNPMMNMLLGGVFKSILPRLKQAAIFFTLTYLWRSLWSGSAQNSSSAESGSGATETTSFIGGLTSALTQSVMLPFTSTWALANWIVSLTSKAITLGIGSVPTLVSLMLPVIAVTHTAYLLNRYLPRPSKTIAHYSTVLWRHSGAKGRASLTVIAGYCYLWLYTAINALIAETTAWAHDWCTTLSSATPLILRTLTNTVGIDLEASGVEPWIAPAREFGLLNTALLLGTLFVVIHQIATPQAAAGTQQPITVLPHGNARNGRGPATFKPVAAGGPGDGRAPKGEQLNFIY